MYFLVHPEFHPLFQARLASVILLSSFVLALLGFFVYLPLVAFLAVFHGLGAWFNATLLLLEAGAAVVAVLFEVFFVDETLVDIFDAVLVKEGFEDLVGRARILHPEAADPVQMLGKPTVSSVYSPVGFRQILEFVMLMPLNLIPVVGGPIVLIVTGYRAGAFHHWRYFTLLELSKKERELYIQRRQLKYTWFGTTALLLQLVPVLSMFFLLTTAAGSALWAAKMERARRMQENASTGDNERYQDDPAP